MLVFCLCSVVCSGLILYRWLDRWVAYAAGIFCPSCEDKCLLLLSHTHDQARDSMLQLSFLGSQEESITEKLPVNQYFLAEHVALSKQG